jgi:hypothetical protein
VTWTTGTLQPLEVNLTGVDTILQGATYYREIPLTKNGSPLDLTQLTGGSPGQKGLRVQLRKTAGDPGTAGVATATIKSPATAGIVVLVMEAVDTAQMTEAEGVYDVEGYDKTMSPEGVDRLIQGSWKLSLEVTKSTS